MKRVLLAVLAVVCVSCGDAYEETEESSSNYPKSEGLRDSDVRSSYSSAYSYAYSVNGCKTGEQKFSSLADYCRGLLDEELNRDCAYSMRRDTYERDCRN